MISAPSAALEAQLNAFLAKIRHETGVPGIGLAVSVQGRTVCAQAGALGTEDGTPLTPGARFRLGCIIKLLLAVTALELAGRAVLDLHAPLAEYLPELRTAPNGRVALLRHLLSHTSGYCGTDVLDPAARAMRWEDLVAHLHESPPLFAPGAVFNYEHGEAVLLAKALERATGMEIMPLVSETVFEPLGLAGPQTDAACAAAVRVLHHRYDSRDRRFVAEPATETGPLWSAAFSNHTATLMELLAVATALARGPHDGGGNPALASAHRARQRAVELPPMVGGPLRELLPTAFGLGSAIFRGGYFGSTGVAPGQCVGLRFHPDEGLAVAVGLNAFVPHLRDLILTAVCAGLTGRSTADAATEPGTLRLDELAGTYRGAGGRVVVAEHREGRLTCAIGAEDSPRKLRVELTADESNRWILRSPAPQLSIGACREPGTATPVLMVGLSAFKRVATRPAQAAPAS